MSNLGIITPHYNNFEGLKNIHTNLLEQTSENWEWIIVDDFSNDFSKQIIENYFKPFNNVKVIFNNFKSNASKCRNIGVDYISTSKIVFLDSDDLISTVFVENRLVDVNDFRVFLNCTIISTKTKEKQPFSTIKNDFFNYFLKSQFPWQTTCVLWDKDFFIKIGRFDERLNILQDVEVSIKALYKSQNYLIDIDNTVDFYYLVEPINTEKRTVKKISEAVEYLIFLICNNYELNNEQLKYLSSYYFLLIKYFCRASKKEDLHYLKKTLKFIKRFKIIDYKSYLMGLCSLKGFQFGIIDFSMLLKINRRLFKQ